MRFLITYQQAADPFLVGTGLRGQRDAQPRSAGLDQVDGILSQPVRRAVCSRTGFMPITCRDVKTQRPSSMSDGLARKRKEEAASQGRN